MSVRPQLIGLQGIRAINPDRSNRRTCGEGQSLRPSPAIRWTEPGLDPDAGLRLARQSVAYRADLVWHLSVEHEVAVARCTQQPSAFFFGSRDTRRTRRSPIRASYRAPSVAQKSQSGEVAPDIHRVCSRSHKLFILGNQAVCVPRRSMTPRGRIRHRAQGLDLN